MVKYLDNNSGFRQWNANRAASASDNKRSRFTSFLWWVVVVMAAWWFISLMISPRSDNNNVTTDTESVIDISRVPKSNIKSDKISADIQGIRISNIALNDFAADASKSTDERKTLLSGDNEFIETGYVASIASPAPDTVWTQKDDTYTWRSADGVTFTRHITADGYLITVTDEIRNGASHDVSLTPYTRIMRTNDSTSSSGVDTGLMTYVNSDLENAGWHKLDKKSYAYSTTNGFIGFADQYWETVVQIDRPDQTMRAKKSGTQYQADASAGAIVIAPGDTQSVTQYIFAGPRDQRVLSTVSNTIAGIDETIDYGWFWFLARPMLWILNTLNALVMNYGVAIIIMTILLRLALWPLTRKSYTSMIAMQKMQPEIARIQKLYANDKARQQMEMLRLYQTHKTSPMSGCLPMLIQIPIFFALYKALLVSVPMRGAHFLWIHDLAAMDPYFILPILMGATMWLQQYLQSAASKGLSNANDAVAQTQKMMRWMPLIFTVMFAWMPAGLVLYWTVSNLFGILQMYIIKRAGK